MSLTELRSIPLCKYLLWGGDPVHLLAPNATNNTLPPPPRRPSFMNPPTANISLSPEGENSITVRTELAPAISQWLESNFNRSQVAAILGAASAVERVMKGLRPASVSARTAAVAQRGPSPEAASPVDPHSPFTLIQGPPGTGK
jgi:predicted XRE-type DNA-binding protein